MTRTACRRNPTCNSSPTTPGVVDEVGLDIHPVLLGAGVPMFGGAKGVKLSLVENRTIDGGCVLATYAVSPQGN